MTNKLLEIQNATLTVDGRRLWSELNLTVSPGEFIAVIGSNGSGKTSLLKAILGQLELDSGSILFEDKEITLGHPNIGYIPQQRTLEEANDVLVSDLVRFGLAGHKLGFFLPSLRVRNKVVEALRCADAEEFASRSFGKLSGGEQQRVRIAQAIVGEPKLLLCDEPLSALDMQQQQIISALIKREAKEHQTAVLFVTHDVNPVLDMVDRVLYLANGKFSIGTPDQVLTSEVLSGLYGTPVDVIRNQGRIVVVGATDHDHHLGEVWQ
ncbi:MAG: metal ABC transporter ATP-binding protein [Rhodoluna sp.]